MSGELRNFGGLCKFTIEAPGLKELAEELKRFPEEISAKMLRGAFGEAAKPVVAAAQRNAPVDSGRLQLKIGKQTALKGDQLFVRVGVLLQTKKQIARKLERKKLGTAAAGIVLTHDPYYDFMVEYGTKHQAPQPFLRPAFDSTKEEFIAVLKSQITSRIDRYKQKNQIIK